jgi:hypothetical protein
MTDRGDEFSVNVPGLDEPTAEAVLVGAELEASGTWAEVAGLLAPLRELPRADRPSAELLDRMEAAATSRRLGWPVRGAPRSVLRGAAALVALLLGFSGLAVANALPAELQRFVARTLDHVGISLPMPDGRGPSIVPRSERAPGAAETSDDIDGPGGTARVAGELQRAADASVAPSSGTSGAASGDPAGSGGSRPDANTGGPDGGAQPDPSDPAGNGNGGGKPDSTGKPAATGKPSSTTKPTTTKPTTTTKGGAGNNAGGNAGTGNAGNGANKSGNGTNSGTTSATHPSATAPGRSVSATAPGKTGGNGVGAAPSGSPAATIAAPGNGNGNGNGNGPPTTKGNGDPHPNG